FFSPHSWLWLNNRSGPTANKKFRQALMFAIDRNMAKDVVWNGLGKVATGPSGSAIKYYTGAVPKYDYDTAKAKALPKEAVNNVEGYSNPEIDKLFADGAVAFPDAAREEIYAKAQKILVEDVPVAWMLELQFPTITRCSVKNLITTGIGVNDGFRDAWIEK